LTSSKTAGPPGRTRTIAAGTPASRKAASLIVRLLLARQASMTARYTGARPMERRLLRSEEAAVPPPRHAAARWRRADAGARLLGMREHDPPPGLMADIEAAYTDRYAAFHRVASAIVGDPDLGRDAVQDGFARAIHRHRDFRGDGSLEGWLWRTVVNVARDLRRSRGRLILTDEVPERGVAGGEVWEDPLGDVGACVAALPERQRMVLFLRYFVDLSYVEIADALEIRVGTVSATLHGAHRALRDALPDPSRTVLRDLAA